MKRIIKLTCKEAGIVLLFSVIIACCATYLDYELGISKDNIMCGVIVASIIMGIITSFRLNKIK